MTDLDVHLPAIQAGDTRAFAAWMAAAEPALRLGLSRFQTGVDVEVVVQEALLRAWHLAPRVRTDERGNSLLRFAQRTARNLAVDEVRRHRLELPAEGDHEPSVEPVEPDPLLRRAVRDCRDKLPKKPRQALDARLQSALQESDADLAERLGMRLNTLLKNFGRARQLLVECLERRGITLARGVVL